MPVISDVGKRLHYCTSTHSSLKQVV